MTSTARSVAIAAVAMFFAAALAGGALFQRDSFASDVSAYLEAAQRIQDGSLYAHDGGDESQVYRYAPWFAAVWIPLSSLPHTAVAVLWVAAMLLCTIWLLWPVGRSGTGLVLIGLVGPFLLSYSWRGNVEALMLVALAFLRSRRGPFLLAVAASLKVMPILLTADYLARREWRNGVVAIGFAILLWLPALGVGASNYPTEPTTMSLWSIGPVAGITAATVTSGSAVFFAWRRSKWTLLCATIAALLASPRLLMLNLGYFLITARFVSPKTH